MLRSRRLREVSSKGNDEGLQSEDGESGNTSDRGDGKSTTDEKEIR